MSDLINRREAIYAICKEECGTGYCGTSCNCAEAIEQLPSAEPSADRPKGEWIDENGTYYANCSKCGYQMDTHQERGYFRYCPNCGAKMEVME